MALLVQLKNPEYQTVINAIITGMFFERSAFLKCSSIEWAPASKSVKFFMPTERAIGRPIADHKEYLPPTQSHIGKMFSFGIPKLDACSRLLVIAMK